MNFYLSASCNNSLEPYIKQLGFNRLFSFYVDRNSLEKYFDYPSKVFLDSGAFSAIRKNISLDIDTYCDFILKNHNQYYPIAALDIVGTSDECSDDNLRNFLYMRSKLPEDMFDKVVPTFHRGEKFKYLERLCEHSNYIALGGMALMKNTNVREEFLRECFSIIPKTHKVHLFGVSTLDLLDKYWDRVYSADSSTWYFAAINGEILSEYGRLIVSERRVSGDDLIKNYVESKGYDMNKLSSEVDYRVQFNLDFLFSWLHQRDNYAQTDFRFSQPTLF